MKERINNRIVFNLYVWISFFIFIMAILITILWILKLNKEIIQQWRGFLSIELILFIVFILFGIADNLIKPAYFEALITTDQILIKSFNPNLRNDARIIMMLFYRKHIAEYKISRQTYNNYKIQIERFGFKRSLILQKIENGRIYESKPINISFLGIKKYTDLIISIDRLKEKITVN